MEKDLYNTSRFFKFFITFLLILSLLFFLGSFYFNENFFLKYSVDKQLEKSSLSNIGNFQNFLLILSILLLIIIFLLLYVKKRALVFITRHKLFLQNLIILLVTLLFFLIIGEILARLLLPNETSEIVSGPMALDFYKNYVHLNSDKLRDREYPIEKGNNTIRIAGLGDSAAYGFGVKDINNTVFKILESRLNKEKPANKTYELINFAKPGYDVEDELNVLKEKALKYSPDIILVIYHLNDIENFDPELEKNHNQWLEIPKIGFILRSISYLYYFFELNTNRLILGLGIRENFENYLIKVYNSDINKETNKKYFKELADISKKKNIAVILTIAPLPYKIKNYPFTKSHDYLKDIADENNFYYVESLDSYKKYDSSELFVNKHDLHPNELGHKLIADELYKLFKKEKIIPAKTTL